MSSFSPDEFEKLMRLSRIALSTEEKKKVQAGLHKILAYVELLKEIDTTDCEPTVFAVPEARGPIREDEIGPVMSREELLANSPSHVGGMIRVPPVMKSSN